MVLNGIGVSRKGVMVLDGVGVSGKGVVVYNQVLARRGGSSLTVFVLSESGIEPRAPAVKGERFTTAPTGLNRPNPAHEVKDLLFGMNVPDSLNDCWI